MTKRKKFYTKELTTAISAAKKASAVLLKGVGGVVRQRGADIKARADFKADRLIKSTIASHFPKDMILTEESRLARGSGKRVWLVDPLDGTTNYVHGLPFYCSLISLVDNDELVLGVCLVHETKEVFWAVKGRGAFLNGKRIRVENKFSLKQSVIGLDAGYSFAENRKLIKVLGKIRPQVAAVTSYFAVGYSFSLLIKSQLGAYIHFCIEPWESAALFIYKEAGGMITDLAGKEINFDSLHLNPNHSFTVLATDKRLHKGLVKLLTS